MGQVLAALGQFKLTVVLIGNAAAAIPGAPVTTLEFDFMFCDTPVIHGVRSCEGLRKRASLQTIGRQTVLVASLDDIVASKKAADRERDLAVLPVLERARKALNRSPRRPHS